MTAALTFAPESQIKNTPILAPLTPDSVFHGVTTAEYPFCYRLDAGSWEGFTFQLWRVTKCGVTTIKEHKMSHDLTYCAHRLRDKVAKMKNASVFDQTRHAPEIIDDLTDLLVAQAAQIEIIQNMLIERGVDG